MDTYIPPKNFPGIKISQLNNAEEMFKVNVDIFQLDESVTPPALIPVRRSGAGNFTRMCLLLFNGHFLYISDIDKAGHAFLCKNCKKLFPQKFALDRPL